MLKISMKAARVNAGLTQKQMGELLNRNNNTVMAWERGHKIPRADEFQKYCEICGVETSDVLLPEVLE